jgi:hypothetical protein
MKKKLIALSSLVLGTPLFALAASSGCTGTVYGIKAVICTIGSILNTIIPIIIVLGVVYFVWGVVSYMIGADEEQKKKGRDKILYGIIGLVVIVGMWGLVRIVTDTFGIEDQSGNLHLPCVPGTPDCTN